MDEVSWLNDGRDFLAYFHAFQNLLNRQEENLGLRQDTEFEVLLVIKYTIALVYFKMTFDFVICTWTIKPFALLMQGLHEESIAKDVVPHSPTVKSDFKKHSSFLKDGLFLLGVPASGVEDGVFRFGVVVTPFWFNHDS
jgi:hypothetical protein